MTSTHRSESTRWRPVVLDVFACQGGIARGYANAGFLPVCVDRDPQPLNPYVCIEADALDVLRELAETGEWRGIRPAFVHASPPCQARTDLQKQNKRTYAELVPPTRAMLKRWGGLYVIENVEGSTTDPEAELIDPVRLCGASEAFPDLRVIRHRLFESNMPLAGAPCPARHPRVFTHDKRKAHYGLLDQNTSYVQVTGGGNCSIANARAAMGIDWMDKHGLNEAIPPAYGKFIGRQVMTHVNQEMVAHAVVHSDRASPERVVAGG